MSPYKGLAQQIQQTAADPRSESEGGFNAILRFFAKWLASVLAEEIFRLHGGVVLGRPFAGMQLVKHAEWVARCASWVATSQSCGLISSTL